jgi:hypothetical protein
MVKHKSRQRSAELFTSLERIALSGPSFHHHGEEEASASDTEALTALADQPIRTVPDSSKTPRMKKFRFQLLHHWLVHNFAPCKVADIGGGKGLLGYLLTQSGWEATVIDPVQQPLPEKYKDILTGQRVKIAPDTQVPCLPAEFEPVMARDFDLLLAMHAHGCNARIIDAAAEHGCSFVIFPCCVIGEPFYPRLGVHWLESLAAYAVFKGHAIQPFRLNFKGQSIGLCSTTFRR